MQVNSKRKSFGELFSSEAPVTHEGAPARQLSLEEQLRRSVLSCLLWEDTFYESGVTIADRIKDLVSKVPAAFVAQLAIEARGKMNLRHVPLLLVRELARCVSAKKSHTIANSIVSDTLYNVIQRPDELAEFLAIYWKDGKKPISAQVKKGLAKAFGKFNEHALAKYNRDGAIKLRDVLFLCHAKPSENLVDTDGQLVFPVVRKDYQRGEVWRHEDAVITKLVNGSLATPDTWEVQLSAGADKKATFERLISEKKLGALAFLRNLRNMHQASVNKTLVEQYVNTANFERVLPFRFITAAKYVPQWEPLIERAMLRCLEGAEMLPGRTILLIDVSGSMDYRLSDKSEMTRMDAACGLAVLLRELCQDCQIYSFSNSTVEIPPRKGFALRDAIVSSQAHCGTYTGQAVTNIHTAEMSRNTRYDRFVIFTDEQSHDTLPEPFVNAKGYVMNVACYKNGIGYGAWNHLDGFSEAMFNYMLEFERAGF